MRQIITICIIQQLLYFTSKVESLTGSKVMSAEDGEFPFIASLQYSDGQHFCTGTLITRKQVITSAHCLVDETPEEIQIVLGVVSLQTATVPYTVTSWLTYDDWADRLGVHIDAIFHDIAIVELTNSVTQPNINPVRLSELHKNQIQGKTAIIMGWKDDANNEVLHKGSVKILKDEDCEKNIHLVTNDIQQIHSRLLCAAATPYILFQCGDSGGPIVDGHNSLLGVSYGNCPEAKYTWGNFSERFLQQYQVTLHFSVDYYRQFIVNVTGYH